MAARLEWMIFFVRVRGRATHMKLIKRCWNVLHGSGVDFVERWWPFRAGESGTVLCPSWWWWWWRPPITRMWLYWSYNTTVYTLISSFEACFFLVLCIAKKTTQTLTQKWSVCVKACSSQMLFLFWPVVGRGFWMCNVKTGVSSGLQWEFSVWSCTIQLASC